jgi:hypothetical protein
MSSEEWISRPMEGKSTPRFEGRGGRGAGAVVGQAIAELSGRQHGVVARWQLERMGITPGEIEGRIARGIFHRLHRGVYAVGHCSLGRDGRWLAAVLAFGPAAVLSHRSAGQLWQIVPRHGIAPEVTRPGFVEGRPDIVVHRSAIPEDERCIEDGIPVTTVPRAMLDMAAVLDMRQLERAWNEIEVRGLTDRLSVPDLLARHPGRRGTRKLQALLGGGEPSGITRNDFEELFVEFLDSHGLPRPLLNGTLPVRERLLEPDCMWLEQRLIAELDGRAVHGTDRAFEGDRQRDRVLLVEGWHSTRITWRQLHDEPAAIAADLRELLGSD